jgi:hypothetical protein
MPTARAMMCCPPARKFGVVLESVSLNLMLERTRLNYARVVIVPKSGPLVPIGQAAFKGVYWDFVRRDGMPSSSGIAARIGQQ